MDLSIIIPSFNTRSLLDRSIRSIKRSLDTSTITYEVIIVDNASTDGTPSFIKKTYPWAILIQNKTNVGYGKANNQAMKKARGRYILLLNSDIEVQNDAIFKLYAFMSQTPHAFIGGKLYNEDGSAQPSSGPFFSLPVVMLMLFAKGDYWGLTRSSPSRTTSVDWVSGACIMGEKSSFIDVGLFDERIFLYMEEVDFLYRAREKGYGAIFFPDARFTHTGAGSSGQRRTHVINIYRGLVYFYSKHRSPTENTLLRFLLTMKAYTAIALGYVLGKRDIVHTYERALDMV